MSIDFERRQIAREAKAIVALAFRNGPIEQIHAGRSCPTCAARWDEPEMPRKRRRPPPDRQLGLR